MWLQQTPGANAQMTTVPAPGKDWQFAYPLYPAGLPALLRNLQPAAPLFFSENRADSVLERAILATKKRPVDIKKAAAAEFVRSGTPGVLPCTADDFNEMAAIKAAFRGFLFEGQAMSYQPALAVLHALAHFNLQVVAVDLRVTDKTARFGAVVDFLCIGPNYLDAASHMPRLYIVDCAHFHHGGWTMNANRAGIANKRESGLALNKYSIHRCMVLKDMLERWFNEAIAPKINPADGAQGWLRNPGYPIEIGPRTMLLAKGTQGSWMAFKGCYDGIDHDRVIHASAYRSVRRLRDKTFARCMWHFLNVYFCTAGYGLIQRLAQVRERRALLSLAHMDDAPHPTDADATYSLTPEQKLAAAIKDPNFARVAAEKELQKLSNAVEVKRVRESAAWINDPSYPGPKAAKRARLEAE